MYINEYFVIIWKCRLKIHAHNTDLTWDVGKIDHEYCDFLLFD